MRKTFVMRGKTSDFKVTGATEVLNFSGYKPGYAYRLVEFKLYPSTAIGATSYELSGTITAARTAADPENPDFNDEGLIATSIITMASTGSVKDNADINIVNDTFLITQNLILAVIDTFDKKHPLITNNLLLAMSNTILYIDSDTLILVEKAATRIIIAALSYNCLL